VPEYFEDNCTMPSCCEGANPSHSMTQRRVSIIFSELTPSYKFTTWPVE